MAKKHCIIVCLSSQQSHKRLLKNITEQAYCDFNKNKMENALTLGSPILGILANIFLDNIKQTEIMNNL